MEQVDAETSHITAKTREHTRQLVACVFVGVYVCTPLRQMTNGLQAARRDVIGCSNERALCPVLGPCFGGLWPTLTKVTLGFSHLSNYRPVPFIGPPPFPLHLVMYPPPSTPLLVFVVFLCR